MVVYYLLAANIGMYVLTMLLYSLGFYPFMRDNLFLWLPQTVFNFKIWEVFTYMFIHDLGSIAHIAFNMFALMIFGRELESHMGHMNFLIYYLLCGVGAGVIQLMVQGVQFGYGYAVTGGDPMLLMSHFAQNPILPVIGASGAIYGLLLAYGMLFPDRVLLLFFVIPMKARNAVIFFGVLELYLGISSTGRIAHFAHLGGLVIGLLYFKFLHHKMNKFVMRYLWKYERKFLQ